MREGLSRRALLKAGGALAAAAVDPQLRLRDALGQASVDALRPVYIGVWDAALKNYAPNLGYDWGGRLLAAWLDR